MMTSRILIVLVGLLWSTLIGEEPKGKGNGVHQKSSKVNETGEKMGTWQKKALMEDNLDKIDQKKFIKAFERQSHLGLRDCLSQWKRGPAKLALRARLTQNGKLEDISAMGETLPACSQRLLLQMNFQAVTKDLKSPAKEVFWRVDW